MKSLRNRWLAPAVVFLAVTGQAQPASLLGTRVENPERITGLWEADDGSSGAVGLNLELTTKVKGTPKTLVDTPQYGESLVIGVYQRGSERHAGDANWLKDNSPGVSWDGHQLFANFRSLRPDIFPVINLNLVYDKRKDIWAGWFERETFAKQVILRRLKASPDHHPSRYVGTWRGNGIAYRGCIHIVQQSDGNLAGWYDRFTLPGLIRFANGIVPLSETAEHYGRQAIVAEFQRHGISFDANAYSGGGMEATFYGRLSRNGRWLRVGWDGGNPTGSNKFRRAKAGSCRR